MIMKGDATIWRRRFGAVVLALPIWRQHDLALPFWRRHYLAPSDLAPTLFGADTIWRRNYYLAPEIVG